MSPVTENLLLSSRSGCNTVNPRVRYSGLDRRPSTPKCSPMTHCLEAAPSHQGNQCVYPPVSYMTSDNKIEGFLDGPTCWYCTLLLSTSSPWSSPTDSGVSSS